MNIAEAYDCGVGFADGFTGVVLDVMSARKDDVAEFIREQLYSGLDGKENPLRPTYLNDPWFKSEAAGHWRGRAEAYMKWKRMITPPARSWLGFAERDANTPNLIITGEFYGSISAVPFANGLRIGSDGFAMGGDIERKYGSVIFKPGRRAVAYFIEYFLKGELLEHYRRWGMAG